MGGPSSEHEVSLHTGMEVIKNLAAKKYEILPVVILRNRAWMFLPSRSFLSSAGAKTAPMKGGVTMRETSALEKVRREKSDITFLAVHGEFGEDGTIQKLLQAHGIPYTGSGVFASAVGMDKPKSAVLFREAGLSVPEFLVFSRNSWRSTPDRIIRAIAKKFSPSCVIKPADRGSSVGVHIVKVGRELRAALTDAFSYSHSVMAQEFVRGREITCGVLERADGSIFSLPPIEIIPKKGAYYDYASKYHKGGSEHVIPPRGIPKKTISAIQDASVAAHAVIGCGGYSRTDFILSEDGKLHTLEINTLPGMTQTSLLPEAARTAGIRFPDLLDSILIGSLRRAA